MITCSCCRKNIKKVFVSGKWWDEDKTKAIYDILLKPLETWWFKWLEVKKGQWHVKDFLFIEKGRLY